MSNQSKDYKKTIAKQLDLNWDGELDLEPEKEEEQPKEDPQQETPECPAQN